MYETMIGKNLKGARNRANALVLGITKGIWGKMTHHYLLKYLILFSLVRYT